LILLEVWLIFKNFLRLTFMLLVLLLVAYQCGETISAAHRRQTSAITYPIIKRDALLNGLQLTTLEKPGTGSVALHFRVNSGALFDLAGKGGLADLTAGMLLKGGGGLTAKNVEDTVEQSGIRIAINVGWDATDIEISGPTDMVDIMFDLLGRLVTTPNFDQKELDALIAQRAAALQAEVANDREILNRKAAEIVYGTHPFGKPARGTANSIKQIKRDDLIYFHKKFYLANNAQLFATGDIRAEVVTKLARTKLGSMRKGDKVEPMFRPPEPPSARRVAVIEKADAPTLQAVIAQSGISRRAQDFFAALVMSEVLRAEFAKQFPKDVVFEFEPRIIEGPLNIYLKTTAENFQDSIAKVLEVLTNLQAHAPTAEQVEAAKALLVSRYAELIKSSPADAVFDVELYGLGRDYMITYADRVNAITATDVQQAARKYLKPQTSPIIVAGNAKAIESDLKKLGNVTTTP
jgi:zinc protease